MIFFQNTVCYLEYDRDYVNNHFEIPATIQLYM